MKKLSEIDGEAGQKVIDGLQAIAPDLARYVIESIGLEIAIAIEIGLSLPVQ